MKASELALLCSIQSLWVGRMCKPQSAHVLAFYLAFFKGSYYRGKQVQMLIIPDLSIWVSLNHTMLAHRLLFIFEISFNVEQFFNNLSCPWVAFFSSLAWSLSISVIYMCDLSCVFFVAPQEEQTWLWDVSMCQVSSLHLRQALQRRISAEQERLLHLHV